MTILKVKKERSNLVYHLETVLGENCLRYFMKYIPELQAEFTSRPSRFTSVKSKR